MEIVLAIIKEGWPYALIAVAFTEIIMRATGESVTRRRYAPALTAVVAIIISWLWSFAQEDAAQMDGILRGLGSGMIAAFAYDQVKAVLVNLPFVKKV